MNDNPPVFDKALYTASVVETAPAGTTIVTVVATDGDAMPPNNQFLYRIESGASDKFRINFQTGEITVDSGASLDRESKSVYLLNVSATDRGAVSLVGECSVQITVLDANDEPPRFVPVTVATNVSENAGVGESLEENLFTLVIIYHFVKYLEILILKT